MYDAALTLLVYTGGILCMAFWVVVFGIIFIEIFDKVTGADEKRQQDLRDLLADEERRY